MTPALVDFSDPLPTPTTDRPAPERAIGKPPLRNQAPGEDGMIPHASRAELQRPPGRPFGLRPAVAKKEHQAEINLCGAVERIEFRRLPAELKGSLPTIEELEAELAPDQENG